MAGRCNCVMVALSDTPQLPGHTGQPPSPYACPAAAAPAAAPSVTLAWPGMTPRAPAASPVRLPPIAAGVLACRGSPVPRQASPTADRWETGDQ